MAVAQKWILNKKVTFYAKEAFVGMFIQDLHADFLKWMPKKPCSHGGICYAAGTIIFYSIKRFW